MTCYKIIKDIVVPLGAAFMGVIGAYFVSVKLNEYVKITNEIHIPTKEFYTLINDLGIYNDIKNKSLTRMYEI